MMSIPGAMCKVKAHMHLQRFTVSVYEPLVVFLKYLFKTVCEASRVKEVPHTHMETTP
jgi:hypothetical protein